MKILQALVLCTLVLLGIAQNIKDRIQSNSDACALETEDLKQIIQEQNFQIEQDAKLKKTLQNKVSEVSATLQERNDHISELSSSLRNLISSGSNCTMQVQSLQQKMETMSSNLQSALNRCKNAGENLEMNVLETGVYYFSNPLSVNWFEAQKFCNKNGLQLASIQNAKENNALVKRANELGLAENGHYWISGTDWAVAGRWYWASTGQDFAFTAWHEGQPDSQQGPQRCASLWRRENVIKWDDENCHIDNFFICEMPQFCRNTF